MACIDGLTGFKEAIQAVFPRAAIHRCVIHPIRQSLKYVGWKDRKAFVEDLKAIYYAPTREAGESALLSLGERWSNHKRLPFFLGSQLGRPGDHVGLSCCHPAPD